MCQHQALSQLGSKWGLTDEWLNTDPFSPYLLLTPRQDGGSTDVMKLLTQQGRYFLSIRAPLFSGGIFQMAENGS